MTAETVRIREALVTAAKRSAEEIAGTFTHPEDEWTPTAIVHGPSGVKVFATPVDSRGEWAQVRSVLAGYVRDTRASAVALVRTGWLAEVDEADAVSGAAESSPDRVETLWVIGLDAGGAVADMATVTRSADGPPTLGEWESVDPGALGGAEVVALLPALRGAWS